MRIMESVQMAFKGKRSRIIKDSDAGTIKGFTLTALSEKGYKTIRYMKKSICKKDVKGVVKNNDPSPFYLVEFGYSPSFSKQVGEKSTLKMVGLLMKGQGCEPEKDYHLEVLK